jgi:hypothetical protein
VQKGVFEKNSFLLISKIGQALGKMKEIQEKFMFVTLAHGQ